MFCKIKKSYEHTIYACYLGYITQAVVNNFVPLLFVTFALDFSLDLKSITLITTVNFMVQLIVDLLSARFVDKIGYRICLVMAHFCSAAGFLCIVFLSLFLSVPYYGIMTGVVLYAVGGGLIEVLISPVVESCPTQKKEAAMSLLHSFYCWGHVGVVLLSTAFFYFFGIKNWRIMALLWILIPLFNAFYFMIVPLYPVTPEGKNKESITGLLKNKMFYLICIIMVCSGASEQAVSQWASAFAENALGVSKTLGDLAGPASFAFFMGLARLIYGKYSDYLPLKKYMLFCAFLCIVSYFVIVMSPFEPLSLVFCAVTGFSVGIFWPGTFSIAAKVIPGGGTAMYALFALAGDIGCSSGPTVVGFCADHFNGELKKGILMAIVFPVVIFFCLLILKLNKLSKDTYSANS